MLFIGCEEAFYLLDTQLASGHPQLLAGCWLEAALSALSHGPFPNFYILYQNQQERECPSKLQLTILCNLIMEVSDIPSP